MFRCDISMAPTDSQRVASSVFRLAPRERPELASPTAAAEPLKDSGSIQAQVAGFSASLFKFQTIVEDDGKDSAGGWQQTNAILGFSDGRGNIVPQVWTCNVTIGMPLRTTLDGAISASKAAQIAAKVTTDASGAVMDKQTNWLPALFCIAFERAMRDIFKDKYKSLGARVSVK